MKFLRVSFIAFSAVLFFACQDGSNNNNNNTDIDNTESDSFRQSILDEAENMQGDTLHTDTIPVK